MLKTETKPTNPSESATSSSLINDISTIQTTEKEMMDNLEMNTSLSPEQRQSILEKINALSNMRIELYKSLNQYEQAYQSTNNQTTITIADQKAAIDIMEKQLNEAKINIEKMEEMRNNQLRLVQINNYYSQKYAEHYSAAKIIGILLIILIFLTWLYKKEWISSRIWMLLIIIVSIIMAYYFWTTFIRMYQRNNMDYSEFDWNFNPSSVSTPTSNITGGSSGNPWVKTTGGTVGGTCVGSNCCSDGLIYDTTNNICVVSSTTEKETFKGLGVNRFLNYSKF